MENNLQENNFITKDYDIYVDGSTMEGGGQILRISLSLAALFRKRLKISNIRGKRSNPGLQNQHLAAATSLANMTKSTFLGMKIGSTELTLTAGDVNNIEMDHLIDCGSAGSIGLLIQQILPCIIFCKNITRCDLKGGSIVNFSPPTFYVNDVLKPILNKFMGIDLSLEVRKHGMFPQGGGRVIFNSNPVKTIQPINITSRGKLKKAFLRIAKTDNFGEYININDLEKDIFKEIKKSLNAYLQNNDEDFLNKEFNLEEVIILEKESINLFTAKKSFTIFTEIILTFENTIISAEALFSEKKETQDVNKIAENLLKDFNEILSQPMICLDEYTVDHLIIFMALAKGKSKIHTGKISLHTLTAFEIVKKFIPSIEFDLYNGEDYSSIEVEGIGWNNENLI